MPVYCWIERNIWSSDSKLATEDCDPGDIHHHPSRCPLVWRSVFGDHFVCKSGIRRPSVMKNGEQPILCFEIQHRFEAEVLGGCGKHCGHDLRIGTSAAKVFQASNNQQLFAISDKSTTKLKKSICFNHSAFHSMKVLSWSNKQTDWYAVQWHCASPFHLTDKALYLFGFVRYFIQLVQTHWILSGGIRLSCLQPPPGKLLYKSHLCRCLTSLWL